MTYEEKLLKYRLQEADGVRLKKLFGPNPPETAFAAAIGLWNEHCSYKSSKIHLRKFQFKTGKKASGQGENAGIIDLGREEKAAFKMESHNHPSHIIPYHGAATGVGGVLRDIFAVGARPVLLGNYLCFGRSAAALARAEGATRGIGGYGNCIGVPNVTGRTEFSAGFEGNTLVNVLALGLLEGEMTPSAASGPGNYVIYAGAATGRDGILGASMASESFAEPENEVKSEESGASSVRKETEQKAAVQTGDPFFGKQLLEAVLEAREQGLILSSQDMGAAGLTGSSFETAAKGGHGLSLHLDRVPLRDHSMSPEEILLSESQERMLFISPPDTFRQLKAVFDSYDLHAIPIGSVLKGKEMEIYWNKKLLLKTDPLQFINQAKELNRPCKRPKPAERQLPKEMENAAALLRARKGRTEIGFSADPETTEKTRAFQDNRTNSAAAESSSSRAASAAEKTPEGGASAATKRRSDEKKTAGGEGGVTEKSRLLQFLGSLEGRSRKCLYERYDQRVGAKTVRDCRSPFGAIRLPKSGRLLAVALGCRSRIMERDTEQGALDAVFEPALQLSLRGFEPQALTDCLNFGNPENPYVMGQFALAVESLAAACKALDIPVVSGNVSFYNESKEAKNGGPACRKPVSGGRRHGGAPRNRPTGGQSGGGPNLGEPGAQTGKGGFGVSVTPMPATAMVGLKESNSRRATAPLPESVFSEEGENVFLIGSPQFYFQNQFAAETPATKSARGEQQSGARNGACGQADFPQKQNSKVVKNQALQKESPPVYGALQPELCALFAENLRELSRYFRCARLVSSFGLLGAAARMALGKGIGFSFTKNLQPTDFSGEWLYQALVSVNNESAFLKEAEERGLTPRLIGKTGGKFISAGKNRWTLKELKEAYEQALF